MSALPVAYWLYLTALALGAVLGLVAIMGGDALEPDAEADAQPEVEPGAVEQADVSVAALWTALGVGQLPLGALLTLDLLLFGGIGVVVSELLRPLLPLALASLVALPAALVLGLLGGGRLSRSLGRLLPSVETHGASRLSLIGRLGRAELPIDRRFGRARVLDDGGALHLLRCVTSGTPLSPGTELVIVDFDPDTGVYTVAAADLLASRGSQD